MRINTKHIDREGHGFISFTAEEPEDMWHVRSFFSLSPLLSSFQASSHLCFALSFSLSSQTYNILAVGDVVTTVTFRFAFLFSTS